LLNLIDYFLLKTIYLPPREELRLLLEELRLLLFVFPLPRVFPDELPAGAAEELFPDEFLTERFEVPLLRGGVVVSGVFTDGSREGVVARVPLLLFSRLDVFVLVEVALRLLLVVRDGVEAFVERFGSLPVCTLLERVVLLFSLGLLLNEGSENRGRLSVLITTEVFLPPEGRGKNTGRPK